MIERVNENHPVVEQKTRATTTKMVNAPQGNYPIRLELVLATTDLESAIESLVKVIEDAESRLAGQKKVVNDLCRTAGRAPMYLDIDRATSASIGAIGADEYYGQPLATAIRSILDRRRSEKRGPATVREIYDTLVAGGFKFEAKDENALRGLRQSLTKNSSTFHKLPNGSYGLLEWYPNAKPARPGDDEEE